MNTIIRASELLSIPSTDLPGAYAYFGDEDQGAECAWAHVREMAETGEPSFLDVFATSTRWSGRCRVVAR